MSIARKYVTCPQCDGLGYITKIEKTKEDSKTIQSKCLRCMGSGKIKGPSSVPV